MITLLARIKEYELVRRVFKAAFYLNLFFVFIVFISGFFFKAYQYGYLIRGVFDFVVFPAILIYLAKPFISGNRGLELERGYPAESRWLRYMLISYIVMILLVSLYMTLMLDPPSWIITTLAYLSHWNIL